MSKAHPKTRANRPGLGGAEKIIAKLPKMPVDRMIGIWQNAIAALVDPKKTWLRHDAKTVIAAIKVEWARRRLLPFDPSQLFKWPDTVVESGSGTLNGNAWLPEGMLTLLGYHVGRTNGKSSNERHIILTEVFSGHLPPAFPVDYLDQWGEPQSSIRLQKLAETIAALTRNAKRRQDDRLHEAIREWETDLKFLYQKYYIGHFHFGWPVTALN